MHTFKFKLNKQKNNIKRIKNYESTEETNKHVKIKQFM